MNNGKYKNKYRIGSIRLKGWDYSQYGYYFVTMCTKNRIHFFGEIKNGVMILSKVGKTVQELWQKIPEHFDNVSLDEFVMMPDHIHGIIIIDNDKIKYKITTSETVETLQCNVSTVSKLTVSKLTKSKSDNKKTSYFSKISPKPGSLSVVIRSFKSVCTRTINEIHDNVFFAWQPRFYDHIIRSENSLNKIRKYIKNNPLNWKTR